MSSSELLGILKNIEDQSIEIMRRREEISRIRSFDLNVIIPNMKQILKTLVVLAKRVEAGIRPEQEIYGALLLEIAKILILSPENAKKTFEFIKKIFSTFPQVLSERALLFTVSALKYFVSASCEILFDDATKTIFAKALASEDIDLRNVGLDSLIYVLWKVPWATDHYMDLLNSIISNESDPLHDVLFERLSIIAEKSFLCVKPIVEKILEKHKDVSIMPQSVVKFIASLNIPIYKKDDLNRIGKLLEEIALTHKDREARILALVHLANLYKNAVLVEEKRRLLNVINQLVMQLSGSSMDIEVALACLKALSIPVWGNLEISEEILNRLIATYYTTSDSTIRYAFVDALFAVYSNLPQFFSPIAKFLIDELIRTTDTEFLKKLTDTLSAVIGSAPNRLIVEKILDDLLGLYDRSEEEFGPFLRLWVAENIFLPIAKIYPEVILDFADRLIEACKKTFDVSLYERFAYIAFEALRRFSKHENAVKLFVFILHPPSYEETYDTLLDMLANLAHRFQDSIVRNFDTLLRVYVAILKAQREVTDVRERYYVVDKAIKDLTRVLNVIRSALKPEVMHKYASLLLHMYATVPPDTLKDVEYVLKVSAADNRILNELKNAAQRIRVPPERLERLAQMGITG